MKTSALIAAAALWSAAASAQAPGQAMPWQKPANIKAAAAAVPAAYASAVKKAPEMITEQPAGKLYKNMYGYSEGFVSMWGMIYEDKKDGVARDFVVGDDGAYYLKSPISFQPTDSWIKGEKGVGDTIVFKLPQQIYLLDNGYDTPVKYYASRMKFKLVNGENQYVIDESSQDMKFVWRNDSLIKADTDLLLGMTSEAGAWNGLGDLVSQTTPNPFTNAAPKDPSKARKYIFTFHPSERNTTQRISEVVIEGDDFYANNIDSKVSDAWIHGKIEGNKVTFGGPQYLGLDKDASQFRFNFPANVAYNDETYTTDYKTLSSVSFDYDPDTQNLTNCQYGFMSNYGYRLIAMEMDVMMQPTFEVWNGTVAKPQNPTIVSYQPATTQGGWIIFDLSRNNVDNTFMDQNNVYFNIYFDDELVTFYPDQYTALTEEMTDVPIDFADARYDFQTFGSQHRVVIYDSGFQRCGVQAMYKDGDNTLYSDIVYSDGTVSGISSATAAAPATVNYYDLSGRPVARPEHGVFIQKSQAADGTLQTRKVVVR